MAGVLAGSALFGPYLGEVDVEVADGIRVELLVSGLVAIDIGQRADAVALPASMQRRPCQMTLASG